MSCNEYFSLSELSSSSLESEIAYGRLCVPNQLKAAIFIILLIGFSCGLGLSLAVFARRVILDRKKWSWKDRLVTLTAIGQAASVCTNAMHLAGVQSRARYLVFALPLSMIVINGYFHVSMWLKATSLLRTREEMSPRSAGTIRFIVHLASYFTMTGFLLLFTILPMIYYDDKWALNWIYSFAVFFAGLVAFVVLAVLLYFGNHMMKESKVAIDAGSIDLRGVRAKLKITMIVWGVFVFWTLMMMIFPIWMGLTYTATSPGLPGVFYYHNILINFGYLGAGISAVWGLRRAHGANSTNYASTTGELKSSSTQGEQKKDTFAGFTVDELNGASAA